MRRLIDSGDVLCALARLTPDQREALIDTVVLGRTQSEVAETMGTSRTRVGQLRKEAIEAMRATRLWRWAA